MTLREQMALDAAAIFNTAEFAEEVVFTPDDGPDVTVIVVISEGQDFRSEGRAVVSAQGFMRVKVSDFPARPKGQITRADGSVWTIGQELSSNWMSRRVEIKTRPRAAFGGKNGIIR